MSNVKIEFAGETMELKSALVAGTVDGGYFDYPTSCFAGSLNPDEIHTALYYANRTVIRLLCEELDVPLDKVDEFLLSAMTEALVKEYNNREHGKDDMDIRKTVKIKKNQN